MSVCLFDGLATEWVNDVDLYTLSKRNEGAVLAPVSDFTKNSLQSSNLSLIAAI